MRKTLFVILLLKCLSSNGQDDTLKTYYGDFMSPIDSFRVLSIFINIVFDQTPGRDTLKDVSTPNWMPGSKNTINQNPPVYLVNYMDADFNPNINGRFTKRWAETSFNKFVVLSDFTVVNIAQSRITPNNPGAYFNFLTLVDSSISLINDLGGLQSIYGHNNITDYDGTLISSSFRFKQKSPLYNGKIDFIQVFFRNSSKYYGSFDGGGTTGYIFDSLMINVNKYINDGSVNIQPNLDFLG